MVESLKELNKIVQKPHYRETGNWMVRRILRDAALPCTWLLLHTGVTAHQVTLAALLTGILGNVVLGFSGSGAFLTGALLLQLWYYLDHVDSQIARYRKTASLTGRFFDFLMHAVVHGLLYFFLGLHAYKTTGKLVFLFWGALTAFSMLTFNMIHDLKSKAFIEKLAKASSIRRRPPEGESSAAGVSEPSRAARLFSHAHKLCEIHVTMNLLTLAACLELLTRGTVDFRLFAAAGYGLLVPAITVIKIVHMIRTRKFDHEFESLFHTED